MTSDVRDLVGLKPLKFNLGCGTDIRNGFVNVDFRELPGVDWVVDLSTFPWPFPDDSADEILMLDFLEHFPYAVTQQILLECFRVLVPGGRLVIQAPDALHTMRALIQEGEYLCNRCGCDLRDQERNSCERCGQSKDDVSEAAMGRFYGGQDYPGNFHQTCFTERSLNLKARAAGFKNVTALPPQEIDHYWRNWTLHMIFEKDDLW